MSDGGGAFNGLLSEALSVHRERMTAAAKHKTLALNRNRKPSTSKYTQAPPYTTRQTQKQPPRAHRPLVLVARRISLHSCA